MRPSCRRCWPPRPCRRRSWTPSTLPRRPSYRVGVCWPSVPPGPPLWVAAVFSLWISGWRGGALYPLRVAAKRRGESGAVLFYLIGAAAFIVLIQKTHHHAVQGRDEADPELGQRRSHKMVDAMLGRLRRAERPRARRLPAKSRFPPIAANSFNRPVTKAAPTNEPMEVPHTVSGSLPASINASMTPICAHPRAEPLPRASVAGS